MMQKPLEALKVNSVCWIGNKLQMNKTIDLLKKRWGVTNAWQVLVILFLFAITGISTLYVHQFIDYLLGIG